MAKIRILKLYKKGILDHNDMSEENKKGLLGINLFYNDFARVYHQDSLRSPYVRKGVGCRRAAREEQSEKGRVFVIEHNVNVV